MGLGDPHQQWGHPLEDGPVQGLEGGLGDIWLGIPGPRYPELDLGGWEAPGSVLTSRTNEGQTGALWSQARADSPLVQV